ncbi:hypothetical protein L202_07184 [Cryptococcus amylolentus CBS 6039]|uniref:CCAAT-binding factor domain-containing protein n=1 Tax=Cryptococcus amylolentus CBS 6039 TaxID=1295533 RepID=A0A1E3HEW8_9TREE|nr:hypothetical protein L202_07184 [Cryptococcus amylolentus CBS 6039]ODN74882.1 hypothetical protein L202_07184 [Cryptococcus amylolentus CBS 6039]
MAPSKPKGAKLSTDPLKQVSKYESALTASTFDPNPLLPLIALARHDDPQIVHKAVWALHRVFIKLIGDGKVGGLSGDLVNGAEREQVVGEEGEKAVKAWVRERLLEYVEVLAGLMRDEESALRASSVPLLFSLLPSLSASISSKPIIHIPYFRLILNYLIFPRPSLRGAKPKTKSVGWKIVAANQVADADGVLPEDVAKVVVDDFWAPHDDIRWAFFKEASTLIQGHTSVIAHPENVLLQVLPLNNLPREAADINAFYVSAFSTPPAKGEGEARPVKKSRSVKAKKGKAKAEVDALPDWMKDYESSDSESDSELQAGSKKRTRTSQLSLHASIYSIVSHTTQFTALWESVLFNLRLDEGWTRKILVALHGEQGILSFWKKERRLRVADWLGSLVDQGGVVGMLAMNGLFVLMTEYNFEYPRFYERLYGLLDKDVMHVKYRARFVRLLDIFLKGSLLPAALIASFIKRLSRLALSAPPAGIIIILPFLYNLFKRHPGCMVMLQRQSGDRFANNLPILNLSSSAGFEKEEEKVEKSEADPYDAEEKNPLKTRAIESSCWELSTLQKHYLASVSTLAKVFGEVFTKAEYDMEDFLDHGYGTLFETEIKRKIRHPPALSVALETGAKTTIFPDGEKKEGEDGGEGEEDVVAELWAF